MFYYPNWLQTSPPLFLLLARIAIGVFGLSTVVLRSVPLLLSLVAVWAMLARRPARGLAAVCRAGDRDPRVSPDGGRILPVVQTIRRRSRRDRPGSVGRRRVFAKARSTAVLRAAGRGGRGDDVVVSDGVSAAGIDRSRSLSAIARGRSSLGGNHGRRAGRRCTGGSIRPNYTPALRAYWMSDPETWLTPGMIAAIAFCIVVAARIAFDSQHRIVHPAADSVRPAIRQRATGLVSGQSAHAACSCGLASCCCW